MLKIPGENAHDPYGTLFYEPQLPVKYKQGETQMCVYYSLISAMELFGDVNARDRLLEGVAKFSFDSDMEAYSKG